MAMMSLTDTAMSARRLVDSDEIVLSRVPPEDAHERKRVLNVLAQRRYRRRKKNKQAALEDMLTKVVNGANDTIQEPITTGYGLVDALAIEHLNAYPPDDNDQSMFENISQELDDQSHSSSGPGTFQSLPDPWSMDFLDSDNDAFNSWPSTSNTSTTTTTLSTILQDDEVQNTTFSDDYNLAVPELDLLRASFEIASRMHSAERLWDLQATSIFQDGNSLHLTSELPKNLQPTRTQLSVAHHPILDIIPWPSARDKLIRMYSMPPNFWPRHPDDGSECSVIRLVYDMEAGGIRIWGADPASEESWEVEESLFTAWWWALDRKILVATNRRRLARGQRPIQELSLQGGPKTSDCLST